jgi:hypothetical protein
MTWRHHRRAGDRVFSGLLLIVVGAILLLGNLNLFQIMPLLREWWPLILMIFGIKCLFMFRGTAAFLGAAFWIGAGALFLASTHGLISVAIGPMIWPLLLIWFGVLIAIGHPGRCGSNRANDRSEV